MVNDSRVRISMHNARTRADGSVFDVRHNDRTHSAGSVVGDSELNRYYVIRDDGTPERVEGGKSVLYDDELRVYRDLFGAALDAQNARYLAHGNADRVKSIDDIYWSSRTCVEEVYLCIGKKGQKVDYKDLKKCVGDYIAIMQEKFPQVRNLNVEFHLDEAGQIHAALRRVYVASGPDGAYVSERAALEQMGVPLPDPGRASSRYNNRKVTFTTRSREVWQRVCEARGFDVITEPAAPGKSSMNKEQYVVEKLKQEKEELLKRMDAAQKALDALVARFYEEYGICLADAVSPEIEALRRSLGALESFDETEL